MNATLLPLFIGIPLGGAFLVAFLGRFSRVLSDVLGSASTLMLLALAVALRGLRGTYAVGGWAAPVGIVWYMDGLTAMMLIVVNAISFAATLFSGPYLARFTAKGRYYGLFLLMVAGMNGVVLTGDLFNLFVFLEVASVASYALVAFGCEHEELEASFKYLVLGGVSSVLILLAVGLLYGATGFLTMANVSQAIAGRTGSPLVVMAVVFFVVGFGIKAALVPFHPWLPDAHPSAPAPISAMLSGVLIKTLGIYALARLAFNVIGVDRAFADVLMAIGVLSMTVGVFLAVGQWDFKRLLAYHSISQMGYVVLGLGLGGFLLATGGSVATASLAILGGLFHLVNHAAFKSLLFLCSGSIEQATGTRQLKEMGGLGQCMPLTRATCTVASLSIAGVPPFNGFWSKLLIVIACFQAGMHGLAVITLAVSFVTLVSFLKVLRYAFLRSLPEALRGAREAPFLMSVSMVLLAVLCAGMGLLLVGGAREALLQPAVNALEAGLRYAGAVLAQAGG
jgi:multicomponent Na+:H+ antiporter subunit D